MNKLINWWMTPKFPEVHLKDKTSFIKKWLFHPIKRRLARLYLKLLQQYTDIKVIGITGSAGKTTTKEMLVSILKLDGKTCYSYANIDPIYNIPTTILKTPIGTKYLVLEMGVEYPNEMDFYLWLVKPDIGIITNIFPTHLEFMGDIHGVLHEKSKLVLSLKKNDVAILNYNNEFLRSLSKKISAKTIWVKDAKDPFTVNGLIATQVADSLGIPVNKIKKGLFAFEKPPHRMNWIRHSSGAMIFDDSYNSNPEALKTSLKLFTNSAKKNNKIAVIGDMLELGNNEIIFHKDCGKEIAKINFQVVIGVGKLSKYLLEEVKKNNLHSKIYHFESQSEVLEVLKEYLIDGNYIFVKGSRSIALDRLVDKLV